MSDAVEIITDEATGIKAVIVYDEHSGINPRQDYSNAWVLVEPTHSRYSFGDETEDFDRLEIHCEKCDGEGYLPDENECPDCLGMGLKAVSAETYFKVEQDAALVRPIYRYEHGLCAYSTSDFGDQWDSGICGVAYITKDALKEFEGGKVSAEEAALACLEGELEVLTDWANGTIYGYYTETEDGEQLDESCWGFIGDIKYVEDEARAALKAEVERADKEAKERAYWLDREVVTV